LRGWGDGMAEETSSDVRERTEVRPAPVEAAASAEQLAAELEDLELAVEGMSGLLAGAMDLDVLLTRVAQFAVQAIPDADGAGVTMFDIEHPNTVVASSEFVRQVDEVQYRLNEGPCVMAAAEGKTVISGSLGGDQRWPRFGPRAGRLGVHSALSIPLLLAESALGAINVYAHDREAFTAHSAQLGELFALSATVAVHNARILAQAQRKVSQLQTALTSRATIDQAIGIVRSRSGATAEQAFDRLRQISQRDNVKLNQVAQQVVNDAVRRARARHVEH
jgi:transcriptional regulator with GAF, ATPase, and Fis domain